MSFSSSYGFLDTIFILSTITSRALSFFAYTKRILNAAPVRIFNYDTLDLLLRMLRQTWLESVTFLTRHGFGFSMAALVFMTTVLLWIFEIIIGTAFQGGADGVVGLQIESAKFGGALVVTVCPYPTPYTAQSFGLRIVHLFTERRSCSSTLCSLRPVPAVQ